MAWSKSHEEKFAGMNNVDLWLPESHNLDGKYEIPVIEGTKDVPDVIEWLKFGSVNSNTDKDTAIHMYAYDRVLNRLWNKPDRYIDMFAARKCILAPDFSIYTDMPKILQIFSHYKKHWIAAYYQKHGIQVIPTICWGGHDTFDFCFDGEPKDSVISVSSVGTQKRTDTKQAFMDGYREMMARLHPSTILFYGNVPSEAEGNIVHIKTHTDNIWGG